MICAAPGENRGHNEFTSFTLAKRPLGQSLTQVDSLYLSLIGFIYRIEVGLHTDENPPEVYFQLNANPLTRY